MPLIARVFVQVSDGFREADGGEFPTEHTGRAHREGTRPRPDKQEPQH